MFFRKTKIRKGMGVVVDYEDFIIIRPKYNYRMNASVIVIKNENPIIIDAGTPADPGIFSIKNAFLKYNINPKNVKYIILTHSHQDHTSNLSNLQKLCRNSKSICHIKAFNRIKNLAAVPDYWIQLIDYLGKPKLLKYLYKVLSIPTIMVLYNSFYIYSKIDNLINFELKDSNYQISEFFKIKVNNLKLKIIPTFGHDQGHICILDSNKNLFLGDFVPFTPWIDPIKNSLDQMINSINLILKFNENEVKRAVRSHGDIRRDPNYKGKRTDNGPWFSEKATWEVAPWDEEKARFKYWLDKIYESLETIPKLLKVKMLTTFQITEKIIPHYEKYSFFMREFFIPPAVTWILTYCMKLEEQGIIKKLYKNKNLYWSI